MDKVKVKHVLIFVASVVAIVFVYDLVTTKINSSSTTAPASTATPAATA
jgi:hypothetical protein